MKLKPTQNQMWNCPAVTKHSKHRQRAPRKKQLDPEDQLCPREQAKARQDKRGKLGGWCDATPHHTTLSYYVNPPCACVRLLREVRHCMPTSSLHMLPDQTLADYSSQCVNYVAPSPTLGRNLDRAGPIQAAFSPPK